MCMGQSSKHGIGRVLRVQKAASSRRIHIASLDSCTMQSRHMIRAVQKCNVVRVDTSRIGLGVFMDVPSDP